MGEKRLRTSLIYGKSWPGFTLVLRNVKEFVTVLAWLVGTILVTRRTSSRAASADATILSALSPFVEVATTNTTQDAYLFLMHSRRSLRMSLHTPTRILGLLVQKGESPMSGKMSRNKGARGEREIAKILEGRRTGQMQSQNGASEADVEAGIPGWNSNFHTEVKRQERVEIVKWCQQAESDAADGPGKIPLVVWRKNNDKWRVTLPLDDFLGLVHKAHANGWTKES